MKKLLAVLLALMIIVSMLAGCGSKNDSQSSGENTSTADQKDDVKQNKNEQTQNQDAGPRPKLNTDALEITFGMNYTDGTQIQGDIIIIDNASPAKLYYNINDEEVLYELADNGTITKYKVTEDYELAKDTETAQETLKTETDSILNILSNCGWKFSERNPDLSYRIIDAPNSGAIVYASSDSTWYEVLKDGNVVGLIAVDNQTGIFNYLQTADYSFATIISETENVSIPLD